MSNSDEESTYSNVGPSPAVVAAGPNSEKAKQAAPKAGAEEGTTDDDASLRQHWSSPLLDCCCESSEVSHHVLAYLFPCVAMAVAKSRADATSILFNLFCFPVPCCGMSGPYSLVRIGYGIDGTAGTDCCIGSLLPCCAARRLFTETTHRGEDARWIGDYGSNAERWSEDMGTFNDCGECGRACLVPCLVSHEIHTRLQAHSPQPTNKLLDMFCLLPCSMYGQSRTTYGIASTDCVCEDWCCGCVFYPCGLSRALKETSRREMTMRQRAYAAGAGAAGKTRMGLRVLAKAADTAMRSVGVSGDDGRSVSRAL